MLSFALLTTSVASAQICGDINDDGVLDELDLDLCTINTPEFPWWVCDFNDDGMLTFEDRLVWIHELKGTWLGDKDLDGEFNSRDMILMFVFGKYETGEMAMWVEGDVDGDWRFNSSDLVIAFADGGYEKGPRLIGDYNRNGLLDAGDLDLQAIAMTIGPATPEYDLHKDGVIDYEDRRIWVNDLKDTWIGDANLDYEFNSSDFVQVFQRGKYETGLEAGWQEGDFNGDTVFSSSDLVIGWGNDYGYERGPRPDVMEVPEPAALTPLVIGVIAAFPMARRHAPRCRRLERREI
jgi:hypothetical protein